LSENIFEVTNFNMEANEMLSHRTVDQVLDIARTFLSLTPEIRDDFCCIGAGTLCVVCEKTHKTSEIIQRTIKAPHHTISCNNIEYYVIDEPQFIHPVSDQLKQLGIQPMIIPGNVYGKVVYLADDIRNYPENKDALFAQVLT